MPHKWEMEYACALAACLHLHAARYPVGVIAIDHSHATLKQYLPWSSNPLSNHHLSGLFEIRSDAGALGRCEKTALVARYPSILNNLRVCWEGPLTGANCGRCEKCIRTQLNFIARGLDPGPSFAAGFSAADVALIKPATQAQLAFMREICAEADAFGIADERIEALREVAALAQRSHRPSEPGAVENRQG
jgi:hypothetical protein